MRFWVMVVAGVAFLVLLFMDTEERVPCTVQGEIRYVGTTKYECVRTVFDGLRWDLRWR